MKKSIFVSFAMFVAAMGMTVAVSAQNFAGTKPAEDIQKDAKGKKADEMMNALTAGAEETVEAVLTKPAETLDSASDVTTEELAVPAETVDAEIVEEIAPLTDAIVEEVNEVGDDLTTEVEGLVEIPIETKPTDALETAPVQTEVMAEVPDAPAVVDHSQHQAAPAAPVLLAKPDPRVMAGASTVTIDILPTTTTTPGLQGTLTLTDTEEGLWIKGNFANVPDPGNHGIHIHENGSCADAGAGAGDHFNPGGSKHGNLPEHGHDHAHAGDMGNVQIKADGTGELNVVLPEVGLRKGRYLVGGKAIILHASADVFSPPTGNAGARIGCGVIESAGK